MSTSQFCAGAPPWLSDLRLPLNANRLHLARSQMMLPCYCHLGQWYDYPDILEEGLETPFFNPALFLVL